MENVMKNETTCKSGRFVIGTQSLLECCFAIFVLTGVFLLYLVLPRTQWNNTGKMFGCNFNLVSYVLAVGIILVPMFVFSVIYASHS